MFRGKYLAALAGARPKLRLARQLAQAPAFSNLLAQLRCAHWVVYAKRPFAGPQAVLDYLGRYTHRVAISNQRLVSFDGERVRLRWRDYAHGNKNKVMALDADEFLRRFLLQVLARRFMRIRHYGFLANRTKANKLAHCRSLLDIPPPVTIPPETVEAFLLGVLGAEHDRCPACQSGRLRLVASVAPFTAEVRAPLARSPPR